MLHHLDKLRKRSHATRRNIAMFSSAAFTLMIFSMWWSAWSADAPTNKQNAVTAKNTKAISPTDALASTLAVGKDSVASAFGSLRESFATLSTSTMEVLEDPETYTVQDEDASPLNASSESVTFEAN